jgi:hypothetical protein
MSGAHRASRKDGEGIIGGAEATGIKRSERITVDDASR